MKYAALGVKTNTSIYWRTKCNRLRSTELLVSFSYSFGRGFFETYRLLKISLTAFYRFEHL